MIPICFLLLRCCCWVPTATGKPSVEHRQPFPTELTWEDVCADEARRGGALVEEARSRRRVLGGRRRRNGTVALYVEGGHGVPLTVVEGSVARAEVGSGFPLDAVAWLSTEEEVECSTALGLGRIARVELTLAPDEEPPEWWCPTRGPAFVCQKPRRVVLRAGVCAGGRALATASAETMVVSRARDCGDDGPALPPANDPAPLESVLAGRPDLEAATARLAATLARRGVLCERVDPDDDEACSTRVMDACPACEKKGKQCFFRSYAAPGLPERCVEVCVAESAVRHVWRADMARIKNPEVAQPPDAPSRRDRCWIVQVHGLARWWVAHRAATPFLNDSVFSAGSLGRCAVVGSGHALRCGRWGPRIESAAYDAVFRVNHVVLAPRIMEAQACAVGSRTDFVINYVPVGNFSSESVALRSRAGRTVMKREDRVPVARAYDLPVLLPTPEALSRGIGSGTGTTALGLAVSLCRATDFFGFGLYKRSQTTTDFRYLHYYDPTPNADEAAAGGSHVLSSELRNAIFHAFGIANFIWWWW
ncbi:hypothetical protein CTAYLR_000731 [Chrysophaeum taylorii]|uniref:Uncharacterized protein n=1 Tax=Chrysophaeum taylorii TaxID=2483200 RepID=A0AAD7UAG9_9STRA|nr:hypothetical protein CTAYLR_000731 [Chrysophaeum taylorii]